MENYNSKEKAIYWTFYLFFVFVIAVISYFIIATVDNKYGDNGLLVLIILAGVGAYLKGILQLNK